MINRTPGSGPTRIVPANGWSIETMIRSPAGISSDSLPAITACAFTFWLPKKKVKPIVTTRRRKAPAKEFPA